MNSKEGFERLGVGLCEAGVCLNCIPLHTLLIFSMDLGCGGFVGVMIQFRRM